MRERRGTVRYKGPREKCGGGEAQQERKDRAKTDLILLKFPNAPILETFLEMIFS